MIIEDGLLEFRVKDLFDALGAPKHVGEAFAFSVARFKDELGGKLPRPDYEHAIWLDEITDHYIVIRPDKDGVYAFLPSTITRRIR